MPRYPKSPHNCRRAFLEGKEGDFPTLATIDFYRETTNVITNALRSDGRDPLPYRITKDDVIWLFGTKWKDHAVSTKIGYKTALTQYTKFFGNNVMDTVRLKFPHDMRPNVDWLTPEQAKILVEYDGFTPLQKFVIYLMLFCGLRRIECIRLTEADILPAHFMVSGKGALGGKPRLVPISPKMRQALNEYLEWRKDVVTKYLKKRPAAVVPDNLLIRRPRGKQGIMTYDEDGDGLDKTVVRALRKELGFHFANHTLRRTFARTLYIQGTKLRTIADLLGQESTDVTERYIGLINDAMVDAVECLSY